MFTGFAVCMCMGFALDLSGAFVLLNFSWISTCWPEGIDLNPKP